MTKARITRKHIGRPCDLDVIDWPEQHICRTRKSHGRIGSVRHGIVKVIDQYIDGIHTPDNGQYICYTVADDPSITVY